jgi:hypothetical protein
MNAPTILQYLETVANEDPTLNLAMHLIILAALLAVFLVKKASLRRIVFQASIWILLVSVTMRGIGYGYPLHAVTFGFLGIVAFVHLILNHNDVKPSDNRLQTTVSLLFILCGLWYPEFMHKDGAARLLFSPVGVIPAPTLLAALGLMTLVYRGSGRLQYGLTIFMGLVYGAIGTFVLNVHLDITLLILTAFSVYIYFVHKDNSWNIGRGYR